MSLTYPCRTVRSALFAALLLIPLTVIGMLSIRGGEQQRSERNEHASALVLAPVQPQRILETAAPLTPEQVERERHTLIQTARSRLVINAALRDRDVAALKIIQEQVDPVKFVEERLDVRFMEKSELLRIAVRAGSPAEQVAIVGAIAKHFVEQANRHDAEARRMRLDKLSEIHAELDARVQEKRRVLKQLAIEIGDDKPARRLQFHQELTRRHLNSIQDELLHLEAEDRKLRLELGKRAPGAARPEQADAAAGAALQEIDRCRKFLTAEVDKHLADYKQTGAKRVNVEWLQDELKLEQSLLKRIETQRQTLQVEMHAPARFQLVDGPAVNR